MRNRLETIGDSLLGIFLAAVPHRLIRRPNASPILTPIGSKVNGFNRATGRLGVLEGVGVDQPEEVC